MPKFARRRAHWLEWWLIAGLAGCGGDGTSAPTKPVPPTPVLTTITVTLPTASLQAGQTEVASIVGVDQNGAVIATPAVTWTSSSPSVATVDASGGVTALAPGQTQIVAAARGITGQAALTVTATGLGTPVALTAAGQSIAFLTSPDPNVSLAVQSGAQYLIAIVNTDATAASLEDFTLVGTTGQVSAAKQPAIRSTQSPDRQGITAGATPRLLGELPPGVAALAHAQQQHLQVLDDNRRIFAAFGNSRTAWATALRTRSARATIAPVVATIGAVNKVYVKNGLGVSCTSVDSIGARTVAIGQHVIVLADTNSTAWPASLRPDSSFYQAFADEYDQVTWPHILANVGDPLAFDASLSRLGKVTVTITPLLNNFGGTSAGGSVVAFVNGCDFFPSAATGPNANLSNQTEMFYSWVPGSGGVDVATWTKSLRATAAHETKHLVSYTDRILGDSPVFEEIWLEEGLAQESSEIWERRFSQATWKGHATFLQTAACEINLGANAPCDAQNDRPVALLASHLPFFFSYLQTATRTRSEGLGVDTPANYGAGWTFARWATDQYATTDEGTFIKALVNEPRLTGLANLSLHTGQSIPTLLVYWNLATAIFQTPAYTAADVRTTIPSFNFADIFRIGQTGLTCSGTPCGLFTRSGTPVFPVQPAPLSVGAFSSEFHGMPGTSAVFFLLSAPVADTQQIRLLGAGSVPLSASSGLRVAILRVQ